jgi:hypothetical protein
MLYGEARVWLKMRLNGIKRGIKVKSVAYLVIYEYALLNVSCFFRAKQSLNHGHRPAP